MTENLDRLKTALADRYTIEQELGAGGMATVYLAHDQKHDRKVAIKVMRPELSAILGGERFLQETRIAAKLNHPHILPLLDSGTADEQPTAVPPYRRTAFLYYVMPHVEGESLRAKIEREKQLALDEAETLTRQVASALDYAHEQGVIHRDIKPENILLHRGIAVVADFGIALAVTAAGGERLTETGLSLGTPEYMSPEQAAGDRDVDARSDIYSLGAVLYEMVTGEPPQTGATVQAVIAKLLSRAPMRPRVVRDCVPEAMDRAIMKALAKVPADRFASAAEFASALTAEVEAEEEKKSIVVLPFDNLSTDPEQEYFCDGITEEIINALGHVEDLKVIARTSAFAFKGRHEDVREIGRALDVKYLLEGSVRKSGSRLRIMAQLIETADGSHLWSERYDRGMDDVFAVQDEIALAIVDTLKAKLLTEERRALTKRYTDDSELYNLYLLGRHHCAKFTPEDFALSERYLEQAIERDPEFPMAYVGVAEINHFKPFFVDAPPKTAFPKARAYVERALAIDADLADAHAILARIQTFYDWDWEGAEREYQLALALNPNSARAHMFYAHLLNLTERHDRAVEEAARARDLDPLSGLVNAIKGERTYHAGRFEEAIVDLKRAIAIDPSYHYAHALLGWTYWAIDRQGQAISELEIAFAGLGRAPMIATSLANAYWMTDRKHDSNKLFKEVEERTKQEYVPPLFLFSMHKVRGDLERAFEWFEKAVEARDMMLVFCLSWPGDEWRLPDDPRFIEALDRLRRSKNMKTFST